MQKWRDREGGRDGERKESYFLGDGGKDT